MGLTTTGISGLDAQLGGGVPRGSTILLLAEPSNAVSLFSTQFAGGGLGIGDHVNYFQFDRPAPGLRDRMGAFVPSPSRAGRLRVFDGHSTQFGKGAIARGEEDVVTLVQREDALSWILGGVQELPDGQPYRLVVETLSSLISPENEIQVLEFMKHLVHTGHEQGGLHLVSLVQGMHDPVFETKMKHYADAVLELGMERKGFGIYPYVLVSKLLGIRDPVRILLYKETEKGLWLESTKRVF